MRSGGPVPGRVVSGPTPVGLRQTVSLSTSSTTRSGPADIRCGPDERTGLDEAIDANVDAVIGQIRDGSEILRGAEEEGELKIVGAIFDLETGVVSLI